MARVTEGAEGERVDLWALADLCTPWCLHLVATLRIADRIAEGLTGIDDLAAAVECDADALCRVLRHLVGKGVFDEPAPRRFALNEAAEGLRSEAQGRWLDLDGIGGRMAHAWRSLPAAVRTGRSAYHEVFGRPFWEDLDVHPEVAASFDAFMGSAGHGVPDPEVLLKRDWEHVRHVVDVGGGTGALLATLLQAHPTLQGTLVDLPRTVARAGALFRTAGVAERVTMAGQSVFDPLPAGADLYVLKNLLADWPDAEAAAILRRCTEAARAARPVRSGQSGPVGRIVVLGGVSPDDPRGPSPDLLMLVLLGGKERTLSQFRALAAGVGLEVAVAGRLPSGRYAVECRPRSRNGPAQT